MAQHSSAEKRARASERKAARNRQWLSRMKTSIKRVRTAADKEKAASALRATAKLLDQLAAKGVIHKNKAANSKSRLSRMVAKKK